MPDIFLGEEIVTNGGFDSEDGWTVDGPGASIAGGKAAIANSAAGNVIWQDADIEDATSYLVTYTISDLSIAGAGYAFIQLGDTDSVHRTANGSYSEIIVANTLEHTLIIIRAGVPFTTGDTFKIDNLSVKEILTAEKGMTTKVEDWAVGIIAALTHRSVSVFKTAERWNHQIALGNSGIESFERFAPCAFVKCEFAEIRREGDYDVNVGLQLTIAIGQKSSVAGVSPRAGDDSHIGTSKLADLVIAAFEGNHPEGLDCDNFYFASAVESTDHPQRHAVNLFFEAAWLPNF